MSTWKNRRLAKEAKNWEIARNAKHVKFIRLGRFTIAVGKR